MDILYATSEPRPAPIFTLLPILPVGIKAYASGTGKGKVWGRFDMGQCGLCVRNEVTV